MTDARLEKLLDGYSVAADDIRTDYVDGLRLVNQDTAKLSRFLARWSPLIEWGDEKVPKRGKLSDVLECVAANRKGLCRHCEAGEPCFSIFLMMPSLLVRAHFVADEFKVPFNLAVSRLVETDGGKHP